MIHYYAAMGEEENLLAELEKGVDINCKRKDLLDTPLHRAAAKGQAKIVEILLERGADIYAQDKWQLTALYIACVAASTTKETDKLEAYYDIFKLLLAHEEKIRKERPEDYIDKPWLQEIKPSKEGMTPVERLSNNPIAKAELVKIIKEHSQSITAFIKPAQNGNRFAIGQIPANDKENLKQQSMETTLFRKIIQCLPKSSFFNVENKVIHRDSESIPLLSNNHAKGE